jgi:hypothetical protein
VTIREPRRGASESEPVDATHYELHYTIGYLWSLHSLRYLAAGASLNIFAGSALLVWSAPFLMRVHSMNTDEVGAWLGITTGVGGIAGTVLGGLAAQRLARTDPAWLLRLPAVTSALAMPFVLLFLTLPASSAPVMNLGASFFGWCLLGPVLALTQTLAKVRMRALASALVALVINLIGAGFGPLAVGISSDLLAASGPSSIRYALLVPVMMALLGAALCFSRGARHVPSELERALE